MALRLSARRVAALAIRPEASAASASCSASSTRSLLRWPSRSYTCSAPLPSVRTSLRSRYQRASGEKRSFSATAPAAHGHVTPPKPGEELHVTFIEKDGTEITFDVAEGDNLLDIAQANDIEMEGACGGSCACSTCHVIVEDEAMYDKMEEPDDDENDMLDLAFGLTETSRLGCQIKMTKDLDGLRVKLPSMTRNLQASDFGKN